MIATLDPQPTPRSTLNDLADELGPVRLFMLAALAALSHQPRRQQRRAALSLNNHLRKDIGLEPFETPPSMARPMF